ncbi:MAG: hypothetical protein K6G33_05270 [Ruminococcus sp.]|uniref:hypothetical protein n=1 Tax=Ruminococcus sp. TaxID=41978 RepID=UPI0025E9C385|nr:hypothetical protein [Ruminococcus sp.]MCR5600134.1 hypothetical protein [Ruminococcus sp.]
MLSRKALLAEMLRHDVPNRIKTGAVGIFHAEGEKNVIYTFSRFSGRIIARYGKLKLPVYIYSDREIMK